MNKAILDICVQEYIQKNLHSDVVGISLSKSPFPDVSPKELAQQIGGKKRCEKKLPSWYNSELIYYPEKLALEQCSSELTAIYKSKLLLGNQVIDLTGGFGVDAGIFSTKVEYVTHCELNQELSEISHHNSKLLGFAVKHVHTDGLEYLKASKDTYDTIYIDPSRRVSSRKVFMLKDCEPDVISVMEFLLEKSDRVIIKTAPLLDLQSIIKELGNVTAVHIASVKNECKEVLYIIDQGTSGTDPMVTCALLVSGSEITYTFRFSEEKDFRINQYSDPLGFIYEPDVALLKAGCFKLITRDFNVIKLHQHTHLYTSDKLIESFPGRIFKLLSARPYSEFLKNQPFKKANLICRNFPLTPQVLGKKLKITDGGSEYLIFCTSNRKELMVLHCERLPKN